MLKQVSGLYDFEAAFKIRGYPKVLSVCANLSVVQKTDQKETVYSPLGDQASVWWQKAAFIVGIGKWLSLLGLV